MRSEGIELNSPNQKSSDPYMETRYQPEPSFTTPSDYDKLRQFLELDRNVLRFYCVWDDRDSMFGEMKPYVGLTRDCIISVISLFIYFRRSIITWLMIPSKSVRFMSQMMAETHFPFCCADRDFRRTEMPYLVSWIGR